MASIGAREMVRLKISYGATAGVLLLRRYRHIALVLLLDLVLTGFIFTIVQDQEYARTQLEFERLGETDVTTIKKDIERKGGPT